jgi:hypothetical protein
MYSVLIYQELHLQLSSEMLGANKEFRAVTGKKEGYFFQNFVCEGKVVYLLNADGEADRKNGVFKLKPSDVASNQHS